MIERKDVDQPMWRKKVDSTLLQRSETPIPQWLWGIWDIERLFEGVAGKSDPYSKVTLLYGKKEYVGRISKRKRLNGVKYLLVMDESLKHELRDTYLMTYMRSIEAELSIEKNNRDVEEEISFWEFLDIEFDSARKTFLLTSHYTIKPQFPKLFSSLIKSAPLRAVGERVLEKKAKTIYKQDWKPRSMYKAELGAENVIYMLLDTKKKLLYVGEAIDLKRRFDSGHPDIKDWDYYKYNVLSSELAEFRLAIERMVIRDMASLLDNKENITNIRISEYALANRKIDR